MANPSVEPLARGYQLQNYTIAKLLSVGGFSIVYLAHDENDYPVAIKEYLPRTLAARDSVSPVVLARSLEDLDASAIVNTFAYQAGLMKGTAQAYILMPR